MAAVPRQLIADRRLRQRAAGDAEAAVEIRGRRVDRFVGGDRRRGGVCRRGQRRTDGGRSRDRQAAWKYRPAVDRRVVAGSQRRRVSSAISAASSTPCNATRRQASSGRSRPTSEIKSSPVVVNDLVLIGSYDGTSTRSMRQPALRWKFETDGPVHATPAVHDGVVIVAGCDESFRAIRHHRRQGAVPDRRRRLHGGVAGHRQRPRVLRHLQQRGAGARSAREKISGGTRTRAAVPVLFLGGAGRRSGDRRRPRQADSRHRCRDRQGGVDLHDRARASIRRRRSPGIVSISGPATAASTA